MNTVVFGDWAQGASHSRPGHEKECQDYWRKVDYLSGVKIVAVADGHGSDKCPYSADGSKYATKVFTSLMTDYCNSYEDPDEMIAYLRREGEMKIAQEISREWKDKILMIHKGLSREEGLSEDEILRMYGTTLIGLLVTEKYVFAYQLGDGDLTYVDEEEVRPLIEPDKFLGVETHSLSKTDSWKKAVVSCMTTPAPGHGPYMYMLSTDGLSNSYVNQQEFYRTCRDYFDLIREHGWKAVKENLKGWLSETSRGGCGDDITAVFVYTGGEE